MGKFVISLSLQFFLISISQKINNKKMQLIIATSNHYALNTTSSFSYINLAPIIAIMTYATDHPIVMYK